MILNLIALAGNLLGELTALETPAAPNASPNSGLATLSWAVAVFMLLGLLFVAFKKSKRTHLD